MPIKLRYVDVSFTIVGKDEYGNRVSMPLRPEQTVMVDEFIPTSDQYGTIVVGGDRYNQVCLNSFIKEA